MGIVDRLNKSLKEFPSKSPNPAELIRLRDFLKRMKEAGIASTREYDLPHPDTIGRFLVEPKKQKAL